MTAYLSEDSSKQAVNRPEGPQGRRARQLRVVLVAQRGITAPRNQSIWIVAEGCPIARPERQRWTVGKRPLTTPLGDVVGWDSAKDLGW